MPTASITAPPLTTQLAVSQSKGGGSNSGSMEVPQWKGEDWLTTNPDDLLSEIMDTYSNTSKYFNPQGIRNAYGRNINTMMGMGGQIADNAVREGLARSGQEGGSVNTSMLKAQAMLPVYEGVGRQRAERETAIADMRQREAQMRTQLATNIGQMRTGYLNLLADTYMRGRGQNMQWQGQQFNQGMAEREMALREKGGAGGGGGASADPYAGMQPFQGQITRAPNNSGMGGTEYTPEYKEFLQATNQYGYGAGQYGTAPPQYPRGGGTGFGNQLDAYNRQMAGVLSQSTLGRKPTYNFGTMDSANAAMFGTGGGSGYATAPGYDPMTLRYDNKPVYRSSGAAPGAALAGGPQTSNNPYINAGAAGTQQMALQAMLAMQGRVA